MAALVAGLRRDSRPLRLGALTLLLVTVGKVFVYDLAALTSLYRVGSFIGLGLLLLVAAGIWQRMRPRPLPDLPVPDEPPDERVRERRRRLGERCTGAKVAAMPFTSNPDEIEVSPEDTANALSDNSAQVIDVREQEEWDEGHIDGTLHIPINELGSRRGEIDAARAVIFYCHVGGRSLMAAQAFRTAGYDAYSMAGGIQLWDDQRRPMVPDGATVAGH